MNDSFSGFNPIINFIYFAAVILFSMFFMHPIFLCISLVSALIYSTILNKKKAVKFNILYMIPFLLFLAIMNPIFNHEGSTVLFYLRNNPITLESIIYGVASASMFISVIIWFSCYNAVMTSDKFIYIFGRYIPSLSLLFSMVLSFVPKLKAQIKVISNAQKCIGKDVSNGNIIQRAKNGIKIISILTTWALENSIQTADSMRARGYGEKGRTNFAIYRFDNRDKITLGVLIILILIIIVGGFMGEISVNYFPSIVVKDVSPISIIIYISYGLLCLLPAILDIVEELKWNYIKSRI